jgi:nucleoside-diphosphate-sugar epimerase
MTRNLLRILVTGAGGLLGSELSGALAERGHAGRYLPGRGMAPCRFRARSQPFRGDVRQPGLGCTRTTAEAKCGIRGSRLDQAPLSRNAVPRLGVLV